MAGWTGRSDSRSHNRVVSRWFVMPTAARWAAWTPALERASTHAADSARHQSSGSCSTHPGRGNDCGNSRYPFATTLPSPSSTSAVTPVVPESIPRTCATTAERTGCSTRDVEARRADGGPSRDRPELWPAGRRELGAFARPVCLCARFLYHDTAATEIYTLSLHYALPI